MRVLITGISGFVGSHLAQFALGQRAEVFGVVRFDHAGEELKHLTGIQNRLTLIHGDLTNRVTVSRALEVARPDIVFHLAAQSFVPESWQSPEYTLSNNIFSQLNLFETARALGMDPVFQIAGSSEEYGLVYPDECPIAETNPLRPLSPYGVSKVAQDMLAFQYHKSYGTRVVITRAFNHEGPRRGKAFVTSDFASQIARIEAQLQEPVLRVGNLDAMRDFVDVRDVVRAYWLAVEKCEYGVPYNIGTGEGHPIREVLSMLLDLSPAKGSVRVVQDSEKMRPSDVPLLVADSRKFRRATGWEPKIHLKATLSDLLDYWRSTYQPRAALVLNGESGNRSSVAPNATQDPVAARRPSIKVFRG